MLLCRIVFPHVAGIAALAVNMGLCELQPLARLCMLFAIMNI